ncbi:MAG TPA: FeoA domain-containing protein, partial [Clostridiales bacterium]|nr:FeoA domain-containing protein [Clostridiales bacterium]
MLREGTTGIIKEIHGRPDVKKHLEDLGFVPGDT